jgi:hypothetical protein
MCRHVGWSQEPQVAGGVWTLLVLQEVDVWMVVGVVLRGKGY